MRNEETHTGETHTRMVLKKKEGGSIGILCWWKGFMEGMGRESITRGRFPMVQNG